MLTARTIVLFFAVIVLITGCATDPAQPLSDEPRPVDWPSLRMAADQIHHPLLPPVVLDERDGLSLDEVAILAVISNPELRTIRDQQNLADAQLLQAGLLPNPTLSVDAARPVGSDTQGRVDAFGIGLDWEITALLSRSARKESARSHSDSVALDIAWQEWQVVGAARRAALRVPIANERLKIAGQIEKITKQILEHVRQQTARGTTSISNLYLAENKLKKAVAQRLQAKASGEEDRLMLNRLLGLPFDQSVLLTPETVMEDRVPLAADRLMQGIENRRLDLLALKLGCESQNARLRAAVRSRFPAVHIGFDGGRDTDGVKTIGAGISIELPFFDRNQGVIAEERATRKYLVDEYRARFFAARSDIARLTAAISSAYAQKEMLQQREVLQSAEADGVHRAVTDGQSDLDDYYAAQIALCRVRMLQTDLAEKIVDLYTALQLACGTCNLTELVGQEGLK